MKLYQASLINEQCTIEKHTVLELFFESSAPKKVMGQLAVNCENFLLHDNFLGWLVVEIMKVLSAWREPVVATPILTLLLQFAY